MPRPPQIPGSPATTDENSNVGKSLGFAAGIGGGTPAEVKEAVTVPENATQEELLQAVQLLALQTAAANRRIAELEAEKPDLAHPLAPKVRPVSMAEAKKREKDALDAGEVPPVTLTTEGHYVPALAHTNSDAVDDEIDRREKAEERKAKRAKAH